MELADQTDFKISFPFLDEDNLMVTLTEPDGSIAYPLFDVITQSLIRLKTPPFVGSKLLIERFTSLDERLVDYENAALLTEEDLDTDSRQAFYGLQEANDSHRRVTKELNDKIDGIINGGDGEDIKIIPWTQTASKGQRFFYPPYEFTHCVVFINGVYQDPEQEDPAYVLGENSIILSESLDDGDIVSVWIGAGYGIEAKEVREWAKQAQDAAFNSEQFSKDSFDHSANSASSATEAKGHLDNAKLEVERAKDEADRADREADAAATAKRDAETASGNASSSMTKAGEHAQDAFKYKETTVEKAGEADQSKIKAGEYEDGAKKAADRAEKSAARLESPFADQGSWFMAGGAYPPPPEVEVGKEFSAMWFIEDTGTTPDQILWKRGDYCVYSYKTKQYSRLSGEAKGGTPPKWVEFPGDVLLANEKALKFKDTLGRQMYGVGLDIDNDLIYGDWDQTNKIALMCRDVEQIWAVDKLDENGKVPEGHKWRVLSEKNGMPLAGGKSFTGDIGLGNQVKLKGKTATTVEHNIAQVDASGNVVLGDVDAVVQLNSRERPKCFYGGVSSTIYTTQDAPTWADVGGSDFMSNKSGVTTFKNMYVEPAVDGVFRPKTNNTSSLGTTTNYWKESFVTTATSDINNANKFKCRAANQGLYNSKDHVLIESGAIEDDTFIHAKATVNIKSRNEPILWVNEVQQSFFHTGHLPNWDEVENKPAEFKPTGSRDGDFRVTGTFYCNNDVWAFQTSDARKKSDIVPITNALAKIDEITGYTYFNKVFEQKEHGLIAQEVKRVLPHAVIKRDDETLAMDYKQVLGLLVNAVKELKDEVAMLKEKAA
ncbi:phage tail fiber domain-containing protein [Vibrio panuliri]|nr:phage tail fiber protein [Vibrio panuliri]